MKRKVFLGMLTIVFLASLVSCAGWQTKTTDAYEAVGTLGATYYQTAKTSCDQGILTADTCAKLKDINNKARAVWLQAGAVLKLAINTTDAVKQQTLLTQYNSLMADFSKIMADFLTLIQQFKKGGLDERSIDRIVSEFSPWINREWAYHIPRD